MFADFHTHSLASDGVLAPIELIRRAVVAGYDCLGITDHVGAGGLERMIGEIKKDCLLAQGRYEIDPIAGVELTHVPPETIDSLAREAKELGAEIVIVHGETLVEPVIPGTNRAAVESAYVDILAHPGLLALEDAELAAQNGVFLELSARKGHCLANGHVAQVARAAGAKMLVNSDAHAPSDLMSEHSAEQVALGAGLSKAEATEVRDNALLLIDRLAKKAR